MSSPLPVFGSLSEAFNLIKPGATIGQATDDSQGKTGGNKRDEPSQTTGR